METPDWAQETATATVPDWAVESSVPLDSAHSADTTPDWAKEPEIEIGAPTMTLADPAAGILRQGQQLEKTIARAGEFMVTPVIPEERTIKKDRTRYIVDPTTGGMRLEELPAAPPAKGVTAAMTGTAGAVADFAKFFTSPLGAATLGIGALPAAERKVVALAFSADMASQMPELGAQLGEELAKPEAERDTSKIAKLVASATLNAGMATAGAFHAVKGSLPTLERGSVTRSTPELDRATARRTALPAEEGAPVPDWAAADLTKGGELQNATLQKGNQEGRPQRVLNPGSPAEQQLRPTQESPAVEPLPVEPTKNVPAEPVNPGSIRVAETPPAGVSPGQSGVASSVPLESARSADPTSVKILQRHLKEAAEIVAAEHPAPEYTLHDAVKEAGGVSGPPLTEALAALRKGRTPAQIVREWGGGQEYDALHGILEQIHEAKGAERKRLVQAYADTFGRGKGKADQVVTSIAEAAEAGFKPPGGVPADTTQLIDRLWQEASGKTETNPRRVQQVAEEIARAEQSGKRKSEKAETNPVDDPFAEVMAGVDPAAPELVGMGGAIAPEFANNPRTPTSIKNAQVDAERAQRGLPAAVEPMRRSFGRAWDDAMSIVDAAPDRQDALIAELKAKPRSLTDTEDALLLHRQVDLQNEYGKATRDLAAAYDDARAFPNRLEAVEDLKVRVQKISDQLLELYDVNKAAGTETGRGLAARRMMAMEDFSLSKMELEKRAANDGRPLTDAERMEVTKLHEKIAETQKQFDDYVAKMEAERAERQGRQEVDALIDSVSKQPGYDRNVQSLADRIVTALESQADKARARLKEKFARTSAGVDPTILGDLAIVGAAKISRGMLDFTRWSKAMVDDFGPDVVPWLNQAWAGANAKIDDAIKGMVKGAMGEAVKARVKKTDTDGQRAKIEQGLRQAAVEQRPLAEIGDYVRKLAENFVRSGIKDRDVLIDAVHGVLKEEFSSEITRRQTMDAISGYGDFKPLNPDKIKVELRDLKGQMQQLAKLEDIQARQPLQKSGLERRELSDTERRLIQQVNEAKKKFGVVVSDPARQLKSALDAVKKRLTNSIADLEFQIATRTRTVKQRTPTPWDAESKLLEARRDELKAQFAEMFTKPDLTDAQRAAIATRTIERSIADYETRIKAGDVASRQRRPTVTTPELDLLRTRRDALKAEFAELRDVLDPGRRDRVALSSIKRQLAQRAADYTDRLARADFAPRKRYEVKLDAEALSLKATAEAAKLEFQRGLIRDRLAQRNPWQKAKDYAKEALNLPRTVLSSWDVSAVLRQGGFIAIGNPSRAARAIGPMFRGLASEHQARMVEQEILSRPNAPLYKRAKLYLAPLENLKLSAMEEQMMSTFADRIPGIRASNRAFMTFLNKLRADSFDQLLQSIERKNGTLNNAELEAIGNYINVSTGRGNLDYWPQSGEVLATVFFSPRLVASRFQLLAGQPLHRGSAATRTAILQEYGKFLLGMAAIYGLGRLAGATVQMDPRSSDFGKLKFGNTRLDVLAGLSQNTVLLSRLISGQTKNDGGELKAIRGETGFNQSNSADVLGRFMRSKFSPVIGNTVDVLAGENVVGEKVTPLSAAGGMLIPLPFHSLLDVMKDQGLARGTALEVLSLFGFGLQYYDAGPAANSPEGKWINSQLRAHPGGTPAEREALKAALRQAVQPAKTNAVLRALGR